MQKVRDVLVIIACLAITSFLGFQIWEAVRKTGFKFKLFKNDENNPFLDLADTDAPKDEVENAPLKETPTGESAKTLADIVADLVKLPTLDTLRDTADTNDSAPSVQKEENPKNSEENGENV